MKTPEAAPRRHPFTPAAIALRVAALLLLIALSLVAGCATTPVASGVVRVAVLDGQVLYDVDPTGDVQVEGWWFGARDRYVAANTGITAGDAMAREFDRLDGVEVYSREDLSLFMAQKERLLRRAYPKLTTAQRKKLLAAQDPVDYGRALNVDYVVQAQIFRCSTATNRTTSWWWSDLDAAVNVYDVRTGERIWFYTFEDTVELASQVAIIERFAKEAARRAARENIFGIY